MAEDKIEYSSLVGKDDPFDKIIEKAEQLVEVFGKVEVQIKSAMSQLKGGLKSGPNSVSEVEGLKKTIELTNEKHKVLLKVNEAQKQLTIDIAAAKRAQNEHNAETRNYEKL
jgi:hypothetical protein